MSEDLIAIPHEGVKPDWLEDDTRIGVFSPNSTWPMSSIKWVHTNRYGEAVLYYLPANHWAEPVLRAGLTPWNPKLQGDGPPKDYAGGKVMNATGLVVENKYWGCKNAFADFSRSGEPTSIIGYEPAPQSPPVVSEDMQEVTEGQAMTDPHPNPAESGELEAQVFQIANTHMLAVGASLESVEERKRYVQRLARAVAVLVRADRFERDHMPATFSNDAGVTQGDRKAAASLMASMPLGGLIGSAVVREGGNDGHPFVQAFKAHRLTSLTTARAEMVRQQAELDKANSTIIQMSMDRRPLEGEIARLREARNLAYGLLWGMSIDRRRKSDDLAARARETLLATMTKSDQHEGIDAARAALGDQP